LAVDLRLARKKARGQSHCSNEFWSNDQFVLKSTPSPISPHMALESIVSTASLLNFEPDLSRHVLFPLSDHAQ
jgi:hypothetical protein